MALLVGISWLLLTEGLPVSSSLPVSGLLSSAALARTPSKTAPRNAKRAKSRKPRPLPRVPKPVLGDDPGVPLRDSWERHLKAFLEMSGTTFGAFVAVDPASGRPLAVAEHSRNPKFARHPALEARFPAASIFKIVSAAALLEKVGDGLSACYHGGSGGLTEDHLRDSAKRDRACRSLASAFAHSTNAVFAKLVLKHLGAEVLYEFAERLGFNHRLRVGDYTTLSTARKAKTPLDLGRMAAGFTNTYLSPLHGAVLGAMIANGGRWPSEVRVDGHDPDPGAAGPILSPRTVSRLRSMMRLAASDGTGRKYLAGFSRGVAVKTGTLTSRDGSGLFNTWMVGFYPADKPEFAFAALLSTQGGGPIKAGHLTRFAIETFQRLKKARAGRS